ncbi:MAG TPA: hypothetical protein VHB79_32515 [Polyangiaceae bacterium]|nr:hypothetical protein [Polyangiaceae bacterium]
MRLPLPARYFFCILSVAFVEVACTQLTTVDWSRIPDESAAGTATGATGSGGEPAGGDGPASDTSGAAGEQPR